MTKLNLFSSAIREDGEYRQLVEAVKQQRRGRPKPIMATGLCSGAADAVCAALCEDLPGGRPLLLLCAEEKECRRVADVLTSFGIRAGFYPLRDMNFYNITASREFEQARLGVLLSLTRGTLDAVITTPDAALGYTTPPDLLRESVLCVSSDAVLDPDDFTHRLIASGYVRSDMAEGAGQFARRGGIIDVCYNDLAAGQGSAVGCVRIEFFGDEVDRMCRFDPSTQRVIENVSEVIIPPAREILPTREDLEDIRTEIRKLRAKSTSAHLNETLDGELAAVDTALATGCEVQFIDKYINLVYQTKCCLLDYFSPMTLTVVSGNAAVRDRLKSAEWRAAQEVEALTAEGSLAGKYAEFSAPAEKLSVFFGRHTTVLLDSLMQGASGLDLGGLFGFRSRHAVSCAENETLLKEELEGFVSGQYRVVVMTAGDTQAQNWAGMMCDWGMKAHAVHEFSGEDLARLGRGEILVIPSSPVRPFELPTPRIAVVSLLTDDGSTAKKVRQKRREKDRGSEKILSYADLKEGDYVVHDAYGIGVYKGITTMNAGGVTRDYITIQYAGTDKLFMPVDKLDRVSKYIGAHSDDGTLKLSKFGGAEWGRTKARAKASLKNIAKELTALYAERLRRPGFAFPRDDDFQRDFEAAFEYDETGAQIDAIEEIKEDMEKKTPMDRLLCGDVGYGKTEVAFRAIYKAILAGKQVAFLVPTTILALQHFQTAQSRMRAFAVNVEMLSRFRTPKEQKKIIADLEKGDIDLIIGTHRLLSGEIKFRDLGLLVVDEEQRFGVAQKEKIKQRVGNIDVLSLSATPIPRTLNMSMTGIRDISLLDEAPIDRLPVQTYVLEHDEIIITDAIRRELRRGGQVFYLYNKVETIEAVATRIRRAVPDAHVVVAHGKMEKEQLEDIWKDMIAGDIDVLVSTTIIETGVDVPNANTLIVENADRMGLSQLHQLRGRVGRSPRRAYAYFTFPGGKALTEIAQKRLEAVREYAEFGAGFQIALRDLEIRGAGNVLGAEQHGHLDEVGYDLYIKLLNEAILEEKGEKVQARTECTVSLNTDAYLPDTYVESSAQRMALYKRIAHIKDQEDVNDLYDELVDRYGEPPSPVLFLLDISLLRARAERCDVSAVTQNGSDVRLTLAKFDSETWSRLLARVPFRTNINVGTDVTLTLHLRRGDDTIGVLSEMLQKFLELKRAEK